MKRLLVIVNPHAGKNGYRNFLSDILYIFHKNGYQPTVAFTRCHGDATEIAAENATSYDRIVCIGGDGTLGETVTGLMRLEVEDRPELGYIPMGTTNDSATALGLDHDVLTNANIASKREPYPMDVGILNGNYFFYVAAFGAFTEVSYETPQAQKNALGRLAYYLDAMKRLPKLTHRWCRVEYEDGVMEGDFIFGAISNSRSLGGVIKLKESDGVSLSDGIFEVILIKTPETVLQLGPIMSDVLANKFTSGYITLLRCSKVRFLFQDPVEWTLDGEDGGLQQDVQCNNLPHSIPMVFGQGHE